MVIKHASLIDVKKISNLIHLSTDANPNNYSIQQINAWKKYNTPSNIEKQLKDRKIFCAFKEGELIGTIALKDNFILGFYVNHLFSRKGIGTKLLTHLEDYAKHNHIQKLYLTSTPSAYKFYLNKRFKPIEKITLSIYGVDFPEVRMEKEI